MERAPKGRDRFVGGLPRVDTGADRVILSRETERVVAHRVQHLVAGATMKVRDRIAEGVVLQMPDVRLAARVGQHFQDVGLRIAETVADGPRRDRCLPPRCAHRPTPAATWARSASGHIAGRSC